MQGYRRKFWICADSEKKEAKSDLVLPVVPSAFVNRRRDMVVIEPEAKVDLDESAISYQMPNGMKNENSSEIMIPVFSSLVMKSGEYPIIINIKTGSLKDPEVEMNGGEVDAVLQVE